MTTSDTQLPSSPSSCDLAAEAERLEAIAALADGDLDAGRRAELLASLADDAEALDLLAEVMALTEELDQIEGETPRRSGATDAETDSDVDDAEEAEDAEEGDDEEAEEIPPGRVLPGPWSRQSWAAVAALAAILVLAVVLPKVLEPPIPTPQSMMAALDPANLDADALATMPWSPLRSGGDGGYDLGFDDEPAGPRDSFRWGVLAADLEAALRIGDDERRRALDYEFGRVLPDTVAYSYSVLTDPAAMPAAEALAWHAELQAEIRRWLDPFYYQYGLWTRAAWLAAESGQVEFFRGGAARSLGALEPAEEVRAEWSDLQARVASIRGSGDLAALAAELDRVLHLHAR